MSTGLKSPTSGPCTPPVRPALPFLTFFARKCLPPHHCYTEASPLREPLLAPLAAIAAGIVVSRFVPFGSRELLSAIAAFLILGVFSLWRESRLLAIASALLPLMLAGSLTDVLHHPRPAPVIDTPHPTT